MEFISFFCDDAQTGADGKLDATGIYNELYARSFPARQDRLCLVCVVQWQCEDDGRKQFTIDLNDPSGTSIFTVDGYTDITSRPRSRPPARTHLVLPMTNVVFPEPGVYRTMVELDGTTSSGAALYLTHTDE